MKVLLETIKPYLKWLIPIAVILIVLYFFFDKIRFAVVKMFGSGVKVVNFNDVGSSLSPSKSKAIADGLHVAMGSMGTDEETVYSLLTGLSLLDYNSVFNSFGTRPYIDATGQGSDNFLGVSYDLNFWLYSELNRFELKKLKLINKELPLEF